MSVGAVFLNGGSGVGKSSTLAAIETLLWEAATPYAALDFDYLKLCFPVPADDPFNTRMGLRNLAAVVANYRDAGIDRFAVAHVVTSPADVDRFADALGVDTLLVCRLAAAPDTIAGRLRGRHVGTTPWELDAFLEGVRRLEGELDAAGVDQVRIETDARSPLEIARDVVSAAGWT